MLRSTTLAAAVVASCLAAGAAHAADEYNVSRGVTTDGFPLGLHGVDPVSFLEIGNRIDGTSAYAASHDGVTYYFASEATMKSCQADPDGYLPQFGGFCAYAVALGKKFDGDPKYAAVRDGKLYVFVNGAVLREFQKDPDGWIAKSEAKWPEIRSTPVAQL